MSLGMRVARLVGLFLAKRKVAVWQSSLVRSPIVVGLFQSTILLPMGLVAQLSPQQIEWIIAHELAHVRRHDYLINFLQTWVETLFFFHPMIWWLSHRVRVEREHCCDDMVVEKLGNPSQYGRALLAIEEWNHAESVFALGARDGTLLARVQRLAQRDAKRPSTIGYPISLVLISLLAVVGTGIAWNSLQGGFPGSQEPVSDASNAFGRESLGLQCRLVAIPAGLQAKSIDWSRANVTFATAEDMAFAVEIKNTSRMPISLLSEVFHIAPDNSQPLRWNESRFDQSRFEFEFRDANGNRVPRPVREFFQPWTLGSKHYPANCFPTSRPSSCFDLELIQVRWLGNCRLAVMKWLFVIVGLMRLFGERCPDSSHRRRSRAHGRMKWIRNRFVFRLNRINPFDRFTNWFGESPSTDCKLRSSFEKRKMSRAIQGCPSVIPSVRSSKRSCTYAIVEPRRCRSSVKRRGRAIASSSPMKRESKLPFETFGIAVGQWMWHGSWSRANRLLWKYSHH